MYSNYLILFKQQPRIPAFGDWENSEDVPYTQKFEGARKNKKTGVYSNPNEPGHQQPDPPRRSPLNPSAYTPEPREQAPRTPLHGRRPGADPHHREPVPRRNANPPREQGGNGGSTPRSPYRNAAGSASPMQSNSSAKPRNRAAGMHTPERRPSSEAQGQHTPGRGRTRQSNQSYNPDDEVAVPPFGEWDEANAASGEKYTGIFNRVRDDKLSPDSSARQQSSGNRKDENKVQQTCPCCIL
uniref:RIN4 pathogenic type III effector avirulence factor Avr cleavage site domain-containing protein n=1 Tax=Triticum urartu TaxID=4572 RepID=A0A8R7PFL2_TRIUA